MSLVPHICRGICPLEGRVCSTLAEGTLLSDYTYFLPPLSRRIQPACVNLCSVLDDSLVEANRAARAAAAARLPVQKQTRVSAYTVFQSTHLPS